MNTLFYALLLIVPAMALMGTAFWAMKKRIEGKPVKKAIKINLATFILMVIVASIMTISVSAKTNDKKAQAVQTATVQQETQNDSSKGMGLLAAGIVTGLAGIGGGIAVAAGAPAAIAATSEDPKSFGKAIIFVALGESIALYGVVISILILDKI